MLCLPYSQSKGENAIVIFFELLISLGATVYGPPKSLHQIYTNRKIHNKYAWVGIIQKLKKANINDNEDEEFDEGMEDYLSLFPYG